MNHAELVITRAQKDGDRIAIRMGSRDVTYREFADLSESLASGLRTLGIGARDCIMLFAENAIEALILYHAAARIGAVFAPVHVSFKALELAYAISNAQPKLIVTTSDMLETLNPALVQNECTAPIVLLDAPDQSSGNLHQFTSLLREGEACPPEEFPPEQPLLISFTSGSTSMPKPVLRSHGSETWSAGAYRDVWGFESSDLLLVALSLSWVYGLCSLSQSAFAAGATVVLERRFSPTRTLELIEAREVTAFSGPMSMYAMMLNVLNERDFNTSALRKAFLGGEPRNEPVIEKMEARLGLRLCEAWAMTESFPALVIDPMADADAPSGSLGRVVRGVEFRLVDDQGRDVEDGQPGEAWVRSPGNFLRYHAEPDLTSARRTDDGWIRSGDLLCRDFKGYYTFVTRQGDLIIRGGANISPLEVESAICAHPDIADAVVVGIPDDVLGETVAALVIMRATVALGVESIVEFVSERIAGYKVPTLLFQVDAIPVGATGKKNRSDARKLVLAMCTDSLAPHSER